MVQGEGGSAGLNGKRGKRGERVSDSTLLEIILLCNIDNKYFVGSFRESVA